MFREIDYTLFTKPVQQLSDLNVAIFINTIESCNEITLQLFKQAEKTINSAFEVKGYEDTTSFIAEYNGLAQANIRGLLDDQARLAQETQVCLTEAQEILNDGFTEAKDAVDAFREVC